MPPDVSWEQLNVFQVNIYPDILIVTTSASEEEVIKALDIVTEQEINLDTALLDMGHIAIMARKPDGIKIINF